MRDTIETLIREKSADPLGFEDLVDAWNACFDTSENTAPFTKSTTFESAVSDAMTAIAREHDTDGVGAQLRRMISAFDHAAIVANADGAVVTMNEAALSRVTALPGQSVDVMGLLPIGGRSLSATVAACNARSVPSGDVTLVQAISSQDRPLTLAIVPASAGTSSVPVTLIFIIDPGWRDTAEPLIANAFQLTEAESGILANFLDGKTLGEIATERKRSIATVRTQFQMIMTKTGAGSQAELIRNMLALSQFVSDIKKVGDVATHPYRKRADMLRPGGRTVEVFFAGDLGGELVVLLPNVTMRTFEADIESAFRRAGLCVATLCRPGYGNSDVPAKGQDVGTCLAEDYCALLDQMGAERATVLAQNSASGFAVQLAGLVPDRVKRVVLASAMPPHTYLQAHDSASPLAAAFVRARSTSRMLFRLLMHTALRAWKIGGARRVHAKQLAAFPPDLERLTPERVAEFDAAMRSRFAQGLDQIAIDFELAVSDWRGWVDKCPVPINILHGQHDQSAPIAAVRAFADDFPDKISLTEVSDAGFLLFYSHTDLAISQLK